MRNLSFTCASDSSLLDSYSGRQFYVRKQIQKNSFLVSEMYDMYQLYHFQSNVSNLIPLNTVFLAQVSYYLTFKSTSLLCRKNQSNKATIASQALFKHSVWLTNANVSTVLWSVVLNGRKASIIWIDWLLFSRFSPISMSCRGLLLRRIFGFQTME